MSSEMADEEQRLTSAFRKYRAATGVENPEAWQATRELLQEVSTYRNSRSYSKVVEVLKRCSGRNADSWIDDILNAARFACNRSLLVDGQRKRIIDLSPDVPCPTITSMARANSQIQSKSRAAQVLGKRLLRNALKGIVSGVQAGKTRGSSTGTIKLDLSKLPDSNEALQCLSLLLVLSKQSEQHEDFVNMVKAGGTLSIECRGIFERTVPANPEFTSRLQANPGSHRAGLDGLTLDDPYVRESAAAEKKALQKAREKRMELRDKLLSSLTDDAADRVFTSRGSAIDMLNSVMSAWEGPTETAFADVVAADPDDALLQLTAALDALREDFDDKRVGMLVFPREPTGAVEKRLMARAGEWLVNQMMRANAKAICDQLHTRYSRLPRHAVEVCVRDALKNLRGKIKREPSGLEVAHVAEQVLIYLQPGDRIGLGEAQRRLREAFPGLLETTANAKVTNAAKRIRTKYQFEPSIDTIVWEAARTTSGRRYGVSPFLDKGDQPPDKASNIGKEERAD